MIFLWRHLFFLKHEGLLAGTEHFTRGENRKSCRTEALNKQLPWFKIYELGNRKNKASAYLTYVYLFLQRGSGGATNTYWVIYGLYWGYIGIMERKMETTVVDEFPQVSMQGLRLIV